MTNTNTNIKHLQWLGGIDDDLILRAERARAKRPARVNLKLISVAAAVLALAVLASAIVPGLINRPEQPPIITDTPETSIFDNPNIIWGDDHSSNQNEAAGDPNNIFCEWNGFPRVEKGLIASFENNSPNALFAVLISTEKPIPDDYSHNGITYKEAKDRTAYMTMVQKFLSVYLTPEGFGERVASDSEQYERLCELKWVIVSSGVTVYARDILQNYITDGIFLREKAEYDEAHQTNEALMLSYSILYQYHFETDKSIRQALDKAKIPYIINEVLVVDTGDIYTGVENYSSGRAVAFMTAKQLSELDFSTVEDYDNIMVSHARKRIIKMSEIQQRIA